jgi:hypothetical protein
MQGHNHRQIRFTFQPEKIGQNGEMPATADGQKFGQPLDDTKDQGF